MSFLQLIDSVGDFFTMIHDIILCLPVPVLLLGVSIFGTFLIIFAFHVFREWT